MPVSMKGGIDVVSQATLSVGIHGALGRMGRRLIQLIAEDPGLTLAAALDGTGIPGSATMSGRSAASRRWASP